MTVAPITQPRPGPVLEMRAERIVAALQTFRAAFPGVRPYYATKCNTHAGVLRTLRDAGCGFEVASSHEIDVLGGIGVPGPEVIFSNPVRAREQTARAAAAGVDRFSVDSVEELHRLADEAPGARVYARLATVGQDSVVPSEGKFGVDVTGAVRLLLEARERGLVPYGITFHMGSQSLAPSALRRPLQDVAHAMDRLRRAGVRLEMVDIGGGFPAAYDEPVPPLADFGRAAAAGIAALPYPVEVFAEPGRCLVAEAGTFRCRVIGVAERPSGWWAHTDLGVFHGLMEVLESGGELRYPIRDTRGTRLRRCYHLTGPTCDSQDTFARDVLLSADLHEGDELLIGSAGAYTSVYASRFNGFAPPRVVLT
ncbi:type III PLP-dependent enzyme [Couchioplanes azureus]|uniref:type III PLP-dependent enzyme n=1 Tax=Couchioplanes caeruleus TaxID=56438 RepID=UPI00166F80A6|nr:type III PLP-dependent enzyme [Couchioplanes caeruleus]GGQ73959.1 ornithine decarboxylase [Couchioplanes caeruleus subsp. azureus]